MFDGDVKDFCFRVGLISGAGVNGARGDDSRINAVDGKGKTNLIALWARIIKNRDCSSGSLARPFARLLAPLTR